MSETQTKPVQLTYKVVRPLEHDQVRYEIGDDFSHADPEVIRALRAADCLRLPTELEPAESVAEKMARLEQRLAEMEAEKAESAAEAEAEAAAAAPKGKKAAAAAAAEA